MTLRSLPALSAERSEKMCGYVQPHDDIEIPFAVIQGAAAGPRLVVTAGVHGSEYCSMETALRLIHLSPHELTGTLVVLPILNVQGFGRRSIYVMPEDGKNLNRMFPGRADGSTSERLAHWLVTSVYPGCDAYIDLHGGDLGEALSPFSLFPNGSERSKELAAVFGLPVAVAAGGEGYTINAAHRLGIPSVLAEVGGNGLWDEARVEQMMAGVHRVMFHLGMLRDAPPLQPPPRVVRMFFGYHRPPQGACGTQEPRGAGRSRRGHRRHQGCIWDYSRERPKRA
jgi:uncharacterized protein